MRHSEKHRAFINSDYFKAARMRGLRNAWAKQANGPKCGAKKRSDGTPCRQPVTIEGKRCRYHGGATPKGKEWHRRQWPKKGAAPSRLKVKRVALEIRDNEADARRAAMTETERAEHEARRRQKAPGSPAERSARKKNLEAGKLIAAALERPKPLTAEQAELAARVDALESRAAELGRETDTPDDTLEIFK